MCKRCKQPKGHCICEISRKLAEWVRSPKGEKRMEVARRQARADREALQEMYRIPSELLCRKITV